MFDEFEKAHRDIFNILLQVLDEGWLTDGEGQRVSFSNCVIIGTSNIGSELLVGRKNPIGIGSQMNEWSKDEQTKEIFKVMKNYFRPEFVNRLDEIVIFNKLRTQDFEKIIDILVDDLSKRISHLNMSLKMSREAKTHLLKTIDTKDYGARPLKRKLEQIIENEIATKIIGYPSLQSRTEVVVDVVEGQIQIVIQ